MFSLILLYGNEFSLKIRLLNKRKKNQHKIALNYMSIVVCICFLSKYHFGIIKKLCVVLKVITM